VFAKVVEGLVEPVKLLLEEKKPIAKKLSKKKLEN